MKTKGMGTTGRINTGLNAENKAKLFFWCKEKAGDLRTYAALAAEASNDLKLEQGGAPLVVTANNMSNAWVAVNGLRQPRLDHKIVGGANNIGKMRHAVADLRARVESLERFRLTLEGK